MRILYELRCTVIIEIVQTFYLKSVPAKFKKYLKHISWVISETSSSKLSCNPRHPSRNISCNHRHHLLQPSWRRIFSTSNNKKTGVDSDINSDYKASPFDKLYIRCRKWDTAGFVRTHQQKYWNAFTVGRGHADDGCGCNHRAVPPSADMRSGLRMASASRTKIQNVCSGFTLVSQSVNCCHAGKCSLVFSKDLLTKYIVFCASNLSGYLTHVVEWTGAIWPSSSFRSAVVVLIILLAEKLDSCWMNRGEYLQ